MTTITYPTTQQVFTSTALTPPQIEALFQQTTCTMLGLTSNLTISGSIMQGSPLATLTTTAGVGLGYQVTDSNPLYAVAGYGTGGYGGPANIPANTVVIDITGNVITMSNAVTGSVNNVTLYFTDPTANTSVRQGWQQQGAPGWEIDQDMCSVRAVLEDGEYTKVRDQGTTQNNDGSLTVVREYTRIWKVLWSAWGPNGFDNMRAVASGLLFDVTTGPLSLAGLYVVPDFTTPQYVPELDNGQWWLHTTFEAQFYEQVIETLTTPSVRSVEIIVESPAGQVADFIVHGNN